MIDFVKGEKLIHSRFGVCYFDSYNETLDAVAVHVTLENGTIAKVYTYASALRRADAE